MSIRAALRRAIVRAAPTCTLWDGDFDTDCLYFRPVVGWDWRKVTSAHIMRFWGTSWTISMWELNKARNHW